MVGAALPTLESGVRPALPAVPSDCASTALISSELMCTSALGPAAGDDAGLAADCELSVEELDCDCCVACSNCAIFWSNDCACSAIAAGACGCATGAGRFNTRTIATSDATNVAMLMIRSILYFFITVLVASMLTGLRRWN